MDHDLIESYIWRTWIKQVRVTPEGEFSHCGEECTECQLRDYFDVYKTPMIDHVKPLSDTFQVMNHKGKVYTYYSPTRAAMDYLIDHCADVITKAIEAE
jgi:hypothetical protein